MQNTSHTSRSGGFSFGGLPDVLLDGIFDYSGLPEIAACAAASVELRSALRRRTPALQRRLVLRRFPILTTIIGDDATDTPTPRELFQSQTRLYAEDPAPFPGLAQGSLDGYTFSVEIEIQTHNRTNRTTTPDSIESLFVGRGKVVPGPLAKLRFDIPEGVFNRAWNGRPPPRTADGYDGPDHILYVRLMVSRGDYSRATLGQCRADGYLDQNWQYAPHGIRPRDCSIVFLNFGMWRHGFGEKWAFSWLTGGPNMNSFYSPRTEVEWFAPSEGSESTLDVKFEWEHWNERRPMSTEDFEQALRSYVNWT
jgi:hypothetical protein